MLSKRGDDLARWPRSPSGAGRLRQAPLRCPATSIGGRQSRWRGKTSFGRTGLRGVRTPDDRHVDPDQTQWVLEVVLQATEGPAASAGIEFVRRPRRDGRCTGTVFAGL